LPPLSSFTGAGAWAADAYHCEKVFVRHGQAAIPLRRDNP
jgi:hypothetical protein